jgi:rod shape-determining protein MreD
MIILSYFSKSVPELFLITTILLSYKKGINQSNLRFYVLFSGYVSDVFYFTNYPIYTFSYFVMYLIVFNKLKDFIVFDFFNLFRITFIFLFMEKLFFSFLNLSLGLNMTLYRDITSFLFEIFSTILFLYIYYKINGVVKDNKIYIY